MLPLNWRGRISLPPEAGDDPEQVLDRLQTALIAQRARGVRREPGVIIFWGGLFRLVSSLNPLGSIWWGRLGVERGPEGIQVHYHITFTELVAFATFAAVFTVVTLFSLPGADMGAVPYVAAVAVWALLVGGNIAFTLWRFSAFVHRWSIGEDT